MWGLGGRYYWGRKEDGSRGKIEGIVVAFAWMSSQERHLSSYVELYGSLGWNSLVCHSQFLNMFFPDKAEVIALELLSVLVEELKVRPCPVVFASFSGGPKACMYKIIQIIDGKCDSELNSGDAKLVRGCISGYIFDSSPVDFTSDLGTRFAVHPSVLKISNPPRIATWVASSIASGLDALFLSRFESQRAEYWQTLYSTVSMGAPYLILCSESDDLAPYQIICNFAQRLQELRADVKVITWNGSPHVGHFRQYPVDYKASVTELLGKAAAIYSQRIQRLEGERINMDGSNPISDPFFNLRKAAASSSQSSEGLTLALNDHFLMPTPSESSGGNRNFGSVLDNHQKDLIHLPARPSINAHGVLGQILFDVCVPKDIEDWDIKQSFYQGRRRVVPWKMQMGFNPIKCILRSKL